MSARRLAAALRNIGVIKLTPGLSERLQTLLAPPLAEQAELELGGAITALRRRGYAWIAISRAVDLPLAEVRVLARRCAAGRRRTFAIVLPQGC